MRGVHRLRPEQAYAHEDCVEKQAAILAPFFVVAGQFLASTDRDGVDWTAALGRAATRAVVLLGLEICTDTFRSTAAYTLFGIETWKVSTRLRPSELVQ